MADQGGDANNSIKKKSNDKHCCVPLCNGNGRRNPELSFHKIPKEEALRKEWIRAIRRDPGPMFNISKETVVCSRHFKKEDFKYTPVRKTLTTTSVPSVFPWGKTIKARRELIRCEIPLKKPKVSDEEDNLAEPLATSTCTFDQDNVDDQLEKENHCVFDELADAKRRIEELENGMKSKDEEIGKLKEKLEIERFGVARFSHDNSMFQFYTGFVSISMFYAFFNYFKPAACGMTSYYYKAADTVNVAVGKQRNMLITDELFMFLCRLTCGLMEQDLAVRFNIHVSSVSRKIITWANFMYFVLGSINIWPSRENIDINMPLSFRNLYPSTRVIVDCTELKTERPSSLALGSKCYSSYKSFYTWKGLVGIAPHGALTFIYSLYTGSMSDVEITELCGLKDLLQIGDSIMADKGFVLNKVLNGTGISVNTPPFLMSQGQFTVQQVEETQNIAKLRIHVERHIRRVKKYHLFDGIIPLSMTGTINQLWTVANMLSLFWGPLVKDWQISSLS